MPSSPNIVHESEAQRQHVRLQIPAKVIVGDRVFQAIDVSVGGVSVQSDVKIADVGAEIVIKITFPFSDFGVDVETPAILEYADSENGQVGFRLTSLTVNQRSILTYIIKAYMTGEMVTGQDVLNVVARDNFVKARDNKKSRDNVGEAPTLARQILPLAVIGLIGIFVTLFIGGNLFQQFFVLPAKGAFVQTESLSVRAPVAGLFISDLPPETVSVKKGQVLGRFTNIEAAKTLTQAPQAPLPTEGAPLSDLTNGSTPVLKTLTPEPVADVIVESPCDCYVNEVYAKNNEYQNSNNLLFSLSPIKAKSTINATVSAKDSLRLKDGGKALIQIAGLKTKVRGKIVSVTAAGASMQESQEVTALFQAIPTAIVLIEPTDSLPADLMGRTASVEFLLY
jgi:alginate biosynthesis protein Alg44